MPIAEWIRRRDELDAASRKTERWVGRKKERKRKKERRKEKTLKKKPVTYVCMYVLDPEGRIELGNRKTAR